MLKTIRPILLTIFLLSISFALYGCGKDPSNGNSSGNSASTYNRNQIYNIVRKPTDIPAPIGNRPPKHVTFTLVAEYVIGQLNTDTTYLYWTYNGKVPGPMIRVRVGDLVTIRLKNPKSNESSYARKYLDMTESLDMHAVIGPMGGKPYITVKPGHTKAITFKAQRPGLFIYHCAMSTMAEHLANGMYGMIVVEPAGGLPKVDHEYYISQNEVYTMGSFGQRGLQRFDSQKMFNNKPVYFVYNGAVGSLTNKYPLTAKVGQTVRIFFVNAGPDRPSAFHVIGQIMDKAYAWGSLSNKPLKNISVITVPPGGTLLTEFKLQQPGMYKIIDHSMSTMALQLEGDLIVTGKKNLKLLHKGDK